MAEGEEFGLAPYRFEPTGHGCQLSTGDDISASVKNIYSAGHRTNVMLRGSSLLAKMLLCIEDASLWCIRGQL